MAIATPEMLPDEITDFLITSPSPEQIIAFQPSEGLNERLHELLEKNREETLSPEEHIELNRFLEIGHLLTMLKAKARLKLAENK
jgi:hypothetical protein